MSNNIKNPKLTVNSQYIKDLSFENPNSPESLSNNDGLPKINVDVNVFAKPLTEKLYEVIDDNEIAPADGVVVRIVKQVVGDENAVPVMGEEESTIVDFTTMEIDFGTVKAGTLSKYIFEFTNNGEFPYVIEYIGASCGCTLPTYSNKPVAPGGLGFVEVGFDATDKSGLQETTVTIIGNTLEKVIELKIKAFVE